MNKYLVLMIIAGVIVLLNIFVHLDNFMPKNIATIISGFFWVLCIYSFIKFSTSKGY